MAGVPIKSSINANQSRVDFLDLSHWGRAVMQDIDFYDVGGQTVFPIYGASGGLASAYIFYFVTGFQVWNESPRSGAYIRQPGHPHRVLIVSAGCAFGSMDAPVCATEERNPNRRAQARAPAAINLRAAGNPFHDSRDTRNA